MSTYLLEVGTEELPYKFIPQAIEQLEYEFKNFLQNNKINYETVKVYATPRRLAVLVYGLPEKTADEEKIIKGPIAKIAYDDNGNLTKAGEGFARKNGLNSSDLYVLDNYVHAKVIVKGELIGDILQKNVANIFMKLQGAHFMRWGYNDEKFSRPIKWIVSILDDKEIEIKIIDKKSGNHSRGHRFAQQSVLILNADDYVETMRNACVIVNQEERKNVIVQKAEDEAKKIGAKPYFTPELLEEVTFITEYPVAVVCEFDEEFLTIPEEVTVTVMSSNQRYFALHKDGKLINKFITMANYVGNEFKHIKEGNLRVIKARLDDAVFFFKEDTKIPLSDYVEKLKGVTFQKGMGSMFDKTQRLIKLSKEIAQDMNVNSKDIERTALLCKADLTTHLVFEFTELQGFIGADYAKISGENDKVALGIKEHYFPINAESETATGLEGQIVGIADKIDTVCAVFTAGKKPTGSSDPLGVRRAALGVIKTVLDAKLNINIDKYIQSALNNLPVNNNCIDEIRDFFVQRLIILLNDKFSKTVLDACAVRNPLVDLTDYIERVNIVTKMNSELLLENANRVIRIIKGCETKTINEKYFVEPIENQLYNETRNLQKTASYAKYCDELEKLNTTISKFFEDVLVMDKDENIKQNRISLLALLKEKYDLLADFSKL